MKYVRKIVDDYCLLDLETTGLSSWVDEVIEVGILKIRNNEVIDKYTSLCKPRRPIDSFITKLTGITNDMVESSPAFKDLKNEVMAFIGDDIIVGHNVSFDVGFIQEKFEEEYDNKYVDTLQLARKLYPNFENHKLSTISNELGFGEAEHRALGDCVTTKKLYDTIKQKLIDENIELDSLFYKKKLINVNDFEAQQEVDEDNFFYNKRVVFTGVLEKMTRREAMQLVVNAGGILDNNVVKKTNYLILGNNDYCLSIKDGKSSKHKKAEELKLKGQDIEILDETTFYNLLNM